MRIKISFFLFFFFISYAHASFPMKDYFLKKYDNLVSYYEKNRNSNFTDNQLFIVAESYEQLGDYNNALKLFLSLLKKGYHNYSLPYRIWRLIDDNKKDQFFEYYSSNYGFNYILYRNYLSYLRSKRDIKKIIDFYEKTLYKNFSFATSNIDELISLYMAEGIFDEKYDYFEKNDNFFMVALLAVLKRDFESFKKKFPKLNKEEKKVIFSYIIRHKKMKFLIFMTKNNLIRDKKYLYIVNLLEGKVNFSNLSNLDKGFVVSTLLSFEKYNLAEKLLKTMPKSMINEYEAQILIYKGKYEEAFCLLYKIYKTKGFFSYNQFYDLIERIDIKKCNISDDRFWKRFVYYLLGKNDIERCKVLFGKLKNENEKILLLKMLGDKIPYKEFSILVKKISKKNVIENFFDKLFLNNDKYLLDNINEFEKMKFKNKNEILGDIFFFLKNDNKKARLFYEKIADNEERNYKLALYNFYVNKRCNLKDLNLNYKAYFLMAGDFLVLKNRIKQAIKYYKKALLKNKDLFLKDDIERRLYFYFKDINSLKLFVRLEHRKKNFFWR